MKKDRFKNKVIAGVLCTALVVPILMQVDNVNAIPVKDGGIVPISLKITHWADTYIEQLSKKYDIAFVFEDKDLDAAIKTEDFQNLVRLIIDTEYDGVPDSMAREAVVHEFTRIWAEKTGRDLNNVPVIKMLIYSDTDKIDPKYNHSITVAYMKKIAGGIGSGLFNPKAYVTYGELAALTNNTKKAIEAELEPEVQPIVGGRFETRGNYEVKADKVVFDFELVSHHTEPKEIEFSSGQQFEVIVTDEKDEEVYRYSDGKFFTLALLSKTIKPGETIKWQSEWNMTNKEGEKLTSGKYRAEIKVMVASAEKDEKIEESQLTIVMDFNLAEKTEKTDTESNVQTQYDVTEEGIIKPEFAEKIIKETADKLIQAISTRDSITISDFVHPVKGVRFTPYTNVSLENDIVFSKEGMKGFFEDKNVYLWGYYDGIGSEISLTPSEYYEKFIYSEDFACAEEIGYNEVLSSGNMKENQFEAYENAIVVEYYFPGFNPDYAGMDWKSLRLVFESYEGIWKLTGIINNQWTI